MTKQNVRLWRGRVSSGWLSEGGEPQHCLGAAVARLKQLRHEGNSMQTIAGGKRISDVPFWAVPHLGNRVELLADWHDGSFVYAKRSFGVLDGITHCEDGSNRALVVFEGDGTGDLVDIPFEHLAVAVPKDVHQSALDACMSVPGRSARAVALMWLHGVDLKQRLTRSMYYRMRGELAKHSIDIDTPSGIYAAG